LNQHCINARRSEQTDILLECIELIGKDKGIQCHIAQDTSPMKRSHQWVEVLQAKIRRSRSSVKADVEAKVDSVCSVFNGGLDTFPVSGGGQQLGR
jgi:hypothetical protein